MSKPDGGPAFPGERMEPLQIIVDGEERTHMRPVAYGGMTLRDYFAAAAMQGFIAMGIDELQRLAEAKKDEDISQWAYKRADAMIAEREK